MKIIDPAIASLATAKSLLLDPWGLTEADMARALGEIFTHKVDYADLYFQYTRSEGWSLEEGIVKTGSFSISQGVGVRAVSGEKTAFAYSDSLSAEALLSSAHAVRGIARRGAGKNYWTGNWISRSAPLFPGNPSNIARTRYGIILTKLSRSLSMKALDR